jgi:hypothetical protein
MSRKHKLLLPAFGVTAAALIAWLFCFSLHRPESFIRASLLRSTPLGSNSREVRTFVEGRGWLARDYIGNAGFLKQEAGVPAVEVGVTSIQGDLGHYRSGLFQTYVTAFWGFDTNDHLIDVWVWKTTDGL